MERVSSFKYLGVNISEDLTLDYTHSNTGQESQAKTVPSATAEEIQGLTNNPENFLCRDHRKCIDSVHLSVGMETAPAKIARPCRELCA